MPNWKAIHCGYVRWLAPDGSQMIVGERRGNVSDAEQIGIALAEELLAKGASAILQAVYHESSSS